MALSGTPNYEIEVPCKTKLGIHKHAMLDLEQFGICQTLFLPEELHAWRHLLDRHRPAEQLRIHLSWLFSQRKSIKPHQIIKPLTIFEQDLCSDAFKAFFKSRLPLQGSWCCSTEGVQSSNISSMQCTTRSWCNLRPDAAQVKEMIRKEVESILGSARLRSCQMTRKNAEGKDTVWIRLRFEYVDDDGNYDIKRWRWWGWDVDVDVDVKGVGQFFWWHYIVIPSQLHGIATQVVMRWLTTPHWWTPVWTAKTCHAELKWIENWQRDCFPLELTLKVHQDSLSAVQFRNDLTRDFNVKLLGTRYIPVSRKWLQWSSTRCNSHVSLDLWMLCVNQASFTDAWSQVCR